MWYAIGKRPFVTTIPLPPPPPPNKRNIQLLLFFFLPFLADPSLAKCNSCFETDAASCAKRQKPQTCTLDRDSVGTTHCASLVAKYQLTNGNDMKQFFYRGCIDCKSKYVILLPFEIRYLPLRRGGQGEGR